MVLTISRDGALVSTVTLDYDSATYTPLDGNEDLASLLAQFESDGIQVRFGRVIGASQVGIVDRLPFCDRSADKACSLISDLGYDVDEVEEEDPAAAKLAKEQERVPAGTPEGGQFGSGSGGKVEIDLLGEDAQRGDSFENLTAAKEVADKLPDLWSEEGAKQTLIKAARELPKLRKAPTTAARLALEQALAKFLKETAAALGARVRSAKVPGLEKTAEEDAVRAMLARLNVPWDSLIPAVQAQLTAIARAGGRAALAQWEITDATMLNDVNQVAGGWAAGRAAEMVGRKLVDGRLVDNPDAKWAISTSTRDELRTIVTTAFSEKTPIGELADRIQQAGAFSEARAAMIAATEVAKAEIKGNLAGWRATGMVETVDWSLSADHDDNTECNCSENADGGPYVLDDVPECPDHPHCMCSLSVSQLTGESVGDVGD